MHWRRWRCIYFANKSFEKEDDLDNIQAGKTTLVAILDSKNERKSRAKDKLRNTGKLWWADVYHNCNEEDFKAKIRINPTTSYFILDGFYEDLVLTPTNLKSNPASPYRRLAFTIYQLATVCTYSTLSYLFGVSVSAASKVFNKISWLIVVTLYDRYVRLPTTDEE